MSGTDVHVHFVPPGLGGDGRDWRPEVMAHSHGPSTVRLRGRVIDSVVDEFADLDVIVEASAARGVDRLVLSPWVSLIPAAAAADEAVAVCRAHNRAMADVIAGREGHVAAMAMVPFEHGNAAVEVAEEALELGLNGVELMATYGGRTLGDPSRAEFFAFAAEEGVPVFVHPSTRGLDLPAFARYYLWNSVANPVETAMAAAGLVLSGTMERHPELKVVLAHGGGALLSVWDRIAHSWEVRPEAKEDLGEHPGQSLARLYVDSVVQSPELLGALVAKLGAGRVLLGSDWPFDMGLRDPVGMVRAAGLSDSETAAILAGNARFIYRVSTESNLRESPGFGAKWNS